MSSNIQGGPYVPYPMKCPQWCHLGREYSQGSVGQTALIYYPVWAGLSGSGCAADATGSYPPCPAKPGGGSGYTNGQYWAGFYDIVGDGASGPVPAPTWLIAKTVTAASVTGGGTGYSVGELLSPSNGVPIATNSTSLELQVTSISGGGGTGPITGIKVVTGGQYRQGYLATTFTGASGSGATFSLTWGNAYQDFSVCQKRGFKTVGVGRNFQGVLGFVDRPQAVDPAVGTVPGTVCFTAGTIGGSAVGFTGFAFGGYISAIPTTQYLEYAVSVTTTYTDVTGTYNGTYTSDFSVNPNSGENTLISSSSAYTGSGPDPCLTGDNMGNPLSWSTTMDYNGFMTMFAVAMNTLSAGQWTGSLGSYQLLNASGDKVQTGGVTATGTSLSMSLTTYDFDGFGNNVPVGVWTGNLSNTLIGYTFTHYALGGPHSPTYVDRTTNVTATLSSPWTTSQLYADAISLLESWNLSNDMQYPWRLDGSPNLMPLMTRNEIAAAIPITSFTTASGWVDPSCNVTIGSTVYKVYDGSILGAPHPAGYQGDFCWQWHGMDSGYSVNSYGISIESYNGLNDVSLPLNATQWTNALFSALTGPGPSINFLNPDAAVATHNDHDLQIVKYAEVVEKWSSENYGRPGGYDKFAVDENHVLCVSSGAFSALPSSGLYIYITGQSNSAPSGVYQLSSGATNISSGTLVYNLPSDWWANYYSKVAYPDSGDFIGLLRYQSGGSSSSATAPSLLGRVPVSLTSGTGPYTYTFGGAQTCFALLISGGNTIDFVDLYDSGMNLIAGSSTYPAYRVTDTTFTLPGSFPTAVWAQIHGSVAWYFNSNYPRGRFATLEWTYDLRTPGEISRIGTNVDCSGSPIAKPSPLPGVGNISAFSQTQHCLPNINCAPRVCYFTPNGETIPNSIAIAFPTPTLDPIYKSQWNGQCLSVMESYFWQSPHSPCSGSLIQDDGSCNGTSNYELSEYVEADITPPLYGYAGTTTPNLPPGVSTLALTDPTVSGSGVLPQGPGGNVGPWPIRTQLIAGNAACYNYPNWVIVP